MSDSLVLGAFGFGSSGPPLAGRGVRGRDGVSDGCGEAGGGVGAALGDSWAPGLFLCLPLAVVLRSLTAVGDLRGEFCLGGAFSALDDGFRLRREDGFVLE